MSIQQQIAAHYRMMYEIREKPKEKKERKPRKLPDGTRRCNNCRDYIKFEDSVRQQRGRTGNKYIVCKKCAELYEQGKSRYHLYYKNELTF